MELNEFYTEEIFQDPEAVPLSNLEGLSMMQKVLKANLEDKHQSSDKSLANSVVFMGFYGFQTQCENQQAVYSGMDEEASAEDQMQKNTNYIRQLRTAFQDLAQLSSQEIVLFLNLKPRSIHEAITLIPSLQRFQKEEGEKIITLGISAINSHPYL